MVVDTKLLYLIINKFNFSGKHFEYLKFNLKWLSDLTGLENYKEFNLVCIKRLRVALMNLLDSTINI